jgi:protein-tyrosine phosphatase
MAAALLSAQLAAREAAVAVCSAGLAGTGQPPPAEVIEVMAARGLDVARQRSRAVTPADLARADLILGMSREHVRHATVLLPQAWPRAFTLRELARRGHQAGPRGPAGPLDGWLARAASGRDRRDLLGASPADDIADPAGGPRHRYDATASALDQLTHELADLCWPYARRAAR